MGTGMFSQGQAMDDNALAMIGAGGQLGAQQSAANNAAMNNYMTGYSKAADFTAKRGQSMAGGLTGLGSSLGSFSGLGGTVPTSQYMATPVGRNRMASYAAMGRGGMYPTMSSGGVPYRTAINSNPYGYM